MNYYIVNELTLARFQYDSPGFW